MKFIRAIVLLLPACGWLSLEAQPPINSRDRITRTMLRAEGMACQGITGRTGEHSSAYLAWYAPYDPTTGLGGVCHGAVAELLGLFFSRADEPTIRQAISGMKAAVAASALQANERPIVNASVAMIETFANIYINYLHNPQ